MKSTEVQTLGVYYFAHELEYSVHVVYMEHVYYSYTHMWLLCKHMRIVHNHMLTVDCFSFLLDICTCK